MHLLVLAEDFYPNVSGGANVRWRFCQQAVERGHDVTVLTPPRADSPREETVDGVTIRRPFVGRPSWLPAYSALGFLFRLAYSVALCTYALVWAARHDVDGIHAVSSFTYWVGKVTAVVHRLPLVNFVGYTPSLRPERTSQIKLLFERLNFRFCMGERVFCRNEDSASRVESLGDVDATEIRGTLDADAIQSAADRDPKATRDRYGVGTDELWLASVGRLRPIKHPAGAVTVLAVLPERYRLVIVGDGPDRAAVEDAIERHDVGERVRLLGEQPHDEALAMLAAADAALLTSYTESHPTVAYEALSLGTPVFATPVGTLTDLDHTALHIGDLGELAELIQSANLGDEYSGGNGLDEATLDRFGMARYTDSILEAFTELLDAPGRQH